MKIGLVCPYNIFKGGGVQECVLAVQSGLKRRGHEAFIITPQPADCPNEIPDNILFIGQSKDVKSFHTTAQVSVSLNNDAVESVLDEHKFDILHFHEPWVPIMSRQLLMRSTSINVATFHAKLPETVMSRTVERVITPYTKSILKNLDYLTAVSTPAADYVGQLTDEEVRIIPNGIDLDKYNFVNRITETPVILYVGRLEKRKGVRFLLKAFCELQRNIPEAELWIVGDGPDRAKLERYSESLELSHVTFHGYVDEKKKLELMSKTSVFCSPARYGESFGIVLLEAMAMGLPTVAGNNPGYVSVMKELGLSSIVNPLHTEDFARRLQLFLSDEQFRAIWRNWAKEYVKQFNYEAVIDSYVEVYEEALAEKE